MTITTHVYYKTSDGKEFLDKKSAEIYEAYHKQKHTLEKEFLEKFKLTEPDNNSFIQ